MYILSIYTFMHYKSMIAMQKYDIFSDLSDIIFNLNKIGSVDNCLPEAKKEGFEMKLTKI